MVGGGADNHRIGACQVLDAGGKIGRLAQGELLLPFAFSHCPHDHQTRMDTHPQPTKPRGRATTALCCPRRKVLCFYYTFGEYDVVVIVEAPDNVTAAALAMVVASGGALKALKTTVLMTSQDGYMAMQQASGTSYSPPGR